MPINYEIVGVNAQRASIEVRFFSEALPGGVVYNIDLPLPPPTGEALHGHIQAFVPRHVFEREAALSQGVDLSAVQALTGQVFVVPEPVPVAPPEPVIPITPAPVAASVNPVEVL